MAPQGRKSPVNMKGCWRRVFFHVEADGCDGKRGKEGRAWVLESETRVQILTSYVCAQTPQLCRGNDGPMARRIDELLSALVLLMQRWRLR